jgi:hypothetical protein
MRKQVAAEPDAQQPGSTAMPLSMTAYAGIIREFTGRDARAAGRVPGLTAGTTQ